MEFLKLEEGTPGAIFIGVDGKEVGENEYIMEFKFKCLNCEKEYSIFEGDKEVIENDFFQCLENNEPPRMDISCTHCTIKLCEN
ncbi:MAG: hypothetical protein AABY15_03225 [Nanoarchaeota archaeon]